MTVSAERGRLREAIADQQAAERVLEEAQRAATNARERWSAVSARIGEINAEIEDAQEHAENSSDDVISALAVGGDVLDKPRARIDELRAALDASEIESAKWRHAINLAEQAIEARRNAVDVAQDRVAEAARRVAESELNVSALIARAEAARQATLVATATLNSVRAMLPHASVGRQAIESFMAQPWCAPISVERASGGENYHDWFDALRADADAKMS